MFRVTGQGPVAYRAGERSCGEQVPRLGQVDPLDTGSLQFYAKVLVLVDPAEYGGKKTIAVEPLNSVRGAHKGVYGASQDVCAIATGVSADTGWGGEGADAIVE